MSRSSRYLLIGTVVTAVALFAWQSVSNALLPWHQMTLREFEHPEMMLSAVDAAAPENGVYLHERGVLAAVSFVPGVTDKSALLSIMLIRQLVIDLLAAFVLALVVARLGGGAAHAGLTLGGVALGTGIILELSDWNWYGFSLPYTLVNAADVAINGLIAGLVLGWLHGRIPVRDARAASTDDPSTVP